MSSNDITHFGVEFLVCEGYLHDQKSVVDPLYSSDESDENNFFPEICLQKKMPVSLKSLNLSANPLGNQGIEMVSRFIKHKKC